MKQPAALMQNRRIEYVAMMYITLMLVVLLAITVAVENELVRNMTFWRHHSPQDAVMTTSVIVKSDVLTPLVASKWCYNVISCSSDVMMPSVASRSHYNAIRSVEVKLCCHQKRQKWRCVVSSLCAYRWKEFGFNGVELWLFYRCFRYGNKNGVNILTKCFKHG